MAATLPPIQLLFPRESHAAHCRVPVLFAGGRAVALRSRRRRGPAGGGGTAKIWASPVFAFEHRSDDGGGLGRTAGLATEFHTLVGGLGGSGDKSCFPATASRSELEALRTRQRADWTKRVLLWASKWQDVAWTPQPWSATAAVAPAAAATRFVYCYATDTDVRRTVASLVFTASIPAADPMAEYTQGAAYQDEFKRDVMPVHGVAAAHPSCVFKDTRAEADKSRGEYRRLFSGFNLRFVDLAWQPTGIAPAGPSVPQAPVPPQAAPAAASTGQLPATPGAVAAVQAADVRKYCHVFMQSVGKKGGVRSTVFEDSRSDGSDAAMTASLAAFVAHVRAIQPGVWHEFSIPPAQCFPDSGYCIARVLRRVAGTSQIAGQFCNASREKAEGGWNAIGEADTTLQTIAWPTGP